MPELRKTTPPGKEEDKQEKQRILERLAELEENGVLDQLEESEV